MREGEYVDSLVAEYATLLRARLSEDPQSRHDEAGIIEDLEASANWSTSGARELVRLADNYGAFMLRNALAIAVVLGKEDGARGFGSLGRAVTAGEELRYIAWDKTDGARRVLELRRGCIVDEVEQLWDG